MPVKSNLDYNFVLYLHINIIPRENTSTILLYYFTLLNS